MYIAVLLAFKKSLQEFPGGLLVKDLALLLLVWFLTWEPPHATGVTKKNEKRKEPSCLPITLPWVLFLSPHLVKDVYFLQLFLG